MTTTSSTASSSVSGTGTLSLLVVPVESTTATLWYESESYTPGSCHWQCVYETTGIDNASGTAVAILL